MGQSATAEQAESMTDAQINRIKANCTSALQNLRQLHANDAESYVNRNQIYYSISDKLMARFNGRVVANRLDGGSLVSIAANYDKSLASFRADYQKYEKQMSNVIKIDCKKQPIVFYDTVAETRRLREIVHSSVQVLHGYIEQYSKEFDTFRDQTESKTR